MSVFQTVSGYSNGHTRDNQGHLIAMEHDARRVRRREYDGTWTVLCYNYEGKKLNAPTMPRFTGTAQFGSPIWVMAVIHAQIEANFSRPIDLEFVYGKVSAP